MPFVSFTATSGVDKIEVLIIPLLAPFIVISSFVIPAPTDTPTVSQSFILLSTFVLKLYLLKPEPITIPS
ncbi:hypothetical protein D3C80_1224700 [compost metagenome]